jgi:alpha-beta hydrolase superfamily lysophospholipase
MLVVPVVVVVRGPRAALAVLLTTIAKPAGDALAQEGVATVRRSLPRHRGVGESTLTIYDGFPHVMQMAREEVRGRVWDDTLAWLRAHAEAGDEEEALEDETSPSARLVG